MRPPVASIATFRSVLWMPRVRQGARLEVTAQVQLLRGLIQGSLIVEEEFPRIAVRKESDDDLALFHGIVATIVKGIAKRLEEVQRPLIAGGISVVTDDAKRAVPRSP